MSKIHQDIDIIAREMRILTAAICKAHKLIRTEVIASVATQTDVKKEEQAELSQVSRYKKRKPHPR